MFHVEIKMGTSVVREVNLDERTLWTRFLAPLMANQEFEIEGHEFTPRKTRIKIFQGPRLQPHQLGLGRGWQNVERSGDDVTQLVLAQAREHTTASSAKTEAPAGTDVLRERVIGRLSAGPVTLAEIVELAADLMPDSTEEERFAASQKVTWALLYRGVAQLAPSDE